MKVTLLSAMLLILMSFQSFAASPFDQLGQIETQNKQAADAARADELRRIDAERARQQVLNDDYRRKQATSAQKAREQALQASKARAAEASRIQGREEGYVDQQRALDLEERRLALDAQKAKVARSNEYIDAELHERAAKTDVVQSEADATRNVSSGAKIMMENTGEANVNRSKKWFGN